VKLTYKLSGLNPTVVRSSDLTELGTSWYVSIVPFGGLPANFPLTITQRCQLPFGELTPIIHTIPSSVEGYYQLVPVRIDLPFELELSVPPIGSSALVTIRYEPDIYPIFAPIMSGQSNSSSTTTDPALLAALNAVAASTAATTAAVQASDDNALTYVDTQVEVSLPTATFVVANNQNSIHSADIKARELIIANNNNSGNIKIVIVPPQDGTAYAAITNIVGNPIEKGGNMVLSDPMCRGAVYAIGSLPNMKVSVTKSAKV
jgi:hypothetical protein